MTPPSLPRALIAVLIAGAAVVIGTVGESAPVAAAIGIAAGGAALFALFGRNRPEIAVTAPATTSSGPGLDELIEALDDPLLLVEGGRVARANPAALSLLGGHIVGQDVRLAIRHPAAAEALTAPLAGDSVTVDLAGIGGRDRQWELVVHGVGTSDSRLVRLVDRSAGRAAEKMRVDFVANASHELRTPLATLLGFIETLGDTEAAENIETRARFLGIMGREARRMQRLIDDLISLSRIESERHSAPTDAVDIAPLLVEVAASFVDADIVTQAQPAPSVAGDRAQLSQLLHNLIGNAVKYGRAGEPVEVRLDDGGGMVRLRVIDRGEGIAAEHLPRLTERFYRADAGRSRSLGGTGLGLAIVKHIVERHRGRLDIASTVGVGTTVTVLLPAIQDPLSSKSHATVT